MQRPTKVTHLEPWDPSHTLNLSQPRLQHPTRLTHLARRHSLRSLRRLWHSSARAAPRARPFAFFVSRLCFRWACARMGTSAHGGNIWAPLSPAF